MAGREHRLLDKKDIERILNRMTFQILEKNQGCERLSLIGIRTRGIFLANRVRQRIKEVENRDLEVGILDITLYRDDIFKLKVPEVRKTEIPFDVNNNIIVLFDDVIHTGRTVRAAMDAIMDLGRPKKIQLAVLVDRDERELPISPDYVGLFHQVRTEEEILVRLEEIDGLDAVLIREP
jgi:pyrimidine operon attenuation protein/uracil phosphoribosyltransferase